MKKPMPTLEEAMERMKAAASRIIPLTPEQIATFAKLEEDCVCKHCGRCVLAGPPCCYDSVYELWQKADSEVRWLRKIQGKQAKQIAELKKNQK